MFDKENLLCNFTIFIKNNYKTLALQSVQLIYTVPIVRFHLI